MPGAHGCDLMAGTGEGWPHLLKRFDAIGSITAVDISSGMHRRAMERHPMRKVREILRLRFERGLSHRQISASTGVSKGSLSEYLRRAANAGVTPFTPPNAKMG